MTKHASEYLTATKQFFGDGEYWLFLPVKSFADLEQRFGYVDRDGKRVPKSLMPIYGALLESFHEEAPGSLKLVWAGNIIANEINEIVRVGLIGGNCGPEEDGSTDVGPQRALRLVEMYGVPERPLEEVAAIAFRLLHAAIYGDPAQREAMPDKAAESDRRSETLAKQAGEKIGPPMRARAEQAAPG